MSAKKIPLGINRLNAARMIAGELRNKRKLNDEMVQKAIDTHMVTKNPPRKIRDAIIEEARKLAAGKESIEVTETIIGEHREKHPKETKGRALGRIRHKQYKAGTRWGREERKDVYTVMDKKPVTDPKGIVRVKGCRCRLEQARGTEFSMRHTKSSGMMRIISDPIFAYGGAGWLMGSIVEYSEPQRIGNGYGSISASLSFHFCEGAGGEQGKPFYRAMQLVEKGENGKYLDPDDYYWIVNKQACARPAIQLFLSVGVETELMWEELKRKMTEHLKGKALCSSPLPLYRYRGHDKRISKGDRA